MAALSLGALWLHEHDKRVVAEARSAIYADSVKVLNRKIKSDSLRVVAADSAAQAANIQIAELQQAAREQEKAAAEKTRATVAELRGSLNAAQARQLDAIVAQYDARLAAKDSMFAATKRLADEAHSRQLEARDSVIAGLRQVNATLTNAWENERKVSHPSLAKRLLDTGIKVGVGYTLRALTTNN